MSEDRSNLKKKILSVVVSVYNEEQALKECYTEMKRVLNTLSWDYELIFVNDGSSDGSLEDYSTGDGVVCMDADLQHPPECLPQIIQALEEGNEVISMVRTRNQSAGLIKNITSSGFYWLINRISDVHFEPNASDFFAVSRSVAEVLKGNYREKVRFLRGYVQNVGFQKTTLEYEAGVRVAGESKYSLKKLFIFSVNTILCFSNMPLKLGIYAGILSGAAGMAVLVYTLFTRQGAPSGYATIVVLICFMFAMMFLLIGIIGEYIAILFTELKDRPVYIVRETANIEHN